MTNRLPKQEPKTLDVQSFMEHHLVDFIKDMVKQGVDKKMAIQWAADRFQKGGKYNLQSVTTPFLKRDTETGGITHFSYREGQVYSVADSEVIDIAMDDITSRHNWSKDGLDALKDKIREITQCKVIAIWRMYVGMSSSVSGGMRFISYIGGDEIDMGGGEAEMAGTQTGTLLVSAMDMLVSNGILDLMGQSEL